LNINNSKKYRHIHLNKELAKLIDTRDSNIEKYKDYDLVFLIRNPFERLVSGFLNKYVYLDHDKNHIKNPNNCNTFFDFCNILSKNPESIDKLHFMPQTNGKGWEFYLLLGKPNIKYVIDTENVNDIKDLLDLDIKDLKLHFNQKKSNEKQNEKQNEKLFFTSYEELKQKNNIDYSNFYNSELKKIVYEIYKNDFNFFINKFNINYKI
jgi:hypothetical protein